MQLTGKALIDFETWVFRANAPFIFTIDKLYDPRSEIILHGLILDWLDSVRIYINVYSDFGSFGLEIKDSGNIMLYDHGLPSATRHIAISNGIFIANEIYNSSVLDYKGRYTPYSPTTEI